MAVGSAGGWVGVEGLGGGVWRRREGYAGVDWWRSLIWGWWLCGACCIRHQSTQILQIELGHFLSLKRSIEVYLAAGLLLGEVLLGNGVEESYYLLEFLQTRLIFRRNKSTSTSIAAVNGRRIVLLAADVTEALGAAEAVEVVAVGVGRDGWGVRERRARGP